MGCVLWGGAGETCDGVQLYDQTHLPTRQFPPDS
jgi:hypothetical protein